MSGRNTYTREDDSLLAQYIAKYNPQPEGRSGNVLYKCLVDNEDGKWPWAKRHSWQSWRNHYVKNHDRLDRIIAKYVKQGGNPEPATPRNPQPATPGASQAVPASQVKRSYFTEEEDQNIVDFLAHAPPSLGARKGQKIWMFLGDDRAQYPWAQRRSWQSWRERYIKHAAYFDRAVEKQLRGDDFEDDGPAIAPPKTAKDYRVHRRASQVSPSTHAQNTSPEKRKRVSNAAQEAAPRKKKRISDKDEQPEAGPSRPREAGHDEDAEQAAEDDGEEQPDVEEAQEGTDPDAEESGDDEEEDEDEDDQGPIGSDEYHGEIFESPGHTEDVADAPEGRALSDTSAEEQQELFHMLTNDPHPDVQDDVEMDVDETGEQTMVEVPGDVRDSAADALHGTDASHQAGESMTSRSSPPALKHHQRIVRDLEPALGTPPLSPTDEAQARHHREHDHSPAPTRKHVPRIRRPADEDFFGTPQSKATSNSGTAVSSPTADHLAHIRHNDAVGNDDEDDVKPRAPPRLDEGAWSKAFSDVRGKSRVSGTGRRKSGVDFEDEARVIGVQDTPASPNKHDDDDDGAAAETTPVPWPPLRRKNKTDAPSTPVAGRSAKDKGKARADAVDSTVRTEKIVSVKTVRTVERRVPRALNGTPYVRGAVTAAEDDEESQEHEDAEPEHHPFSQPVFAPRMAAYASSLSTASNPPVPKSDVSRLQRLLSGQLREAPQVSPSKAERNSRPPTAPSAIPPRGRAALSRETISPPGAVRDDSGERFERFEERDEELPGAAPPSPFSDRGNPLPRERRILHEFVPPAFSSRATGSNPALRADKGKAKAVGTSHATGHARRHTLAGPDARDALPGASHSIDHAHRRSVPSAFTIGDDLPRSALSLLFNPPRSGSAHPRSYSLAHPPGSGPSRSVSPYMSADVAAAKRLPANELDLILEIGIGQAFRIMAENHGFGEATVRDAFAATGSLEQTDRLLCRMRESANRTANEVLQSLDGDDKGGDDEGGADADGHGDEDEDEAYPEDDHAEVEDEDGDQFEVEEDKHNSRRPVRNDEEEVEHVLEQDSWMQDDAPLAESSHFDVSHSHRGSSFGPDSRQRKSLLIERVPPSPVEPVEYSPPKRTRAAKHVARQSLSRAPDAMDVDSMNTNMIAGSPDVGHVRPSVAGLGQLAKYSPTHWRRLGSTRAKMETGKALANLLLQ
ncbi:hypothetical protein C8T65DRAFT_833102 [Cerioporus squamosus]|nr:hypothetical protein C8T65DRAFT_833102 [Cerioporus squamosus]